MPRDDIEPEVVGWIYDVGRLLEAVSTHFGNERVGIIQWVSLIGDRGVGLCAWVSRVGACHVTSVLNRFFFVRFARADQTG